MLSVFMKIKNKGKLIVTIVFYSIICKNKRNLIDYIIGSEFRKQD
jgi:hypothetical protein